MITSNPGGASLAKNNVCEVSDYTQLFWGEMIVGTKVQLQALGLGVGKAYPGEPGAAKRSMHVFDPRGLRAQIQVDGPDTFRVSISYPWLPERPRVIAVEYAPDVLKREETYGDLFVGSRAALVQASLVPGDCFPGDPGMRKCKVTINPDGSLPKGAATAYNALAYKPGAKQISRAPAGRFEVLVNIDGAERDRRRQLESQMQREWETSAAGIPRPSPLDARFGAIAAAALHAREDNGFSRFMASLMCTSRMIADDNRA
jgi:hypothetical protein